MLDSVTSKIDAIKSMQHEVVAVSLLVSVIFQKNNGSIFEFIEKLYDFMVSIRFCFISLSDNRSTFMSPRIT